MKRQTENVASIACKDKSLVMWSDSVGHSVLGRDRSETKKSVLVLIVQIWCCVVKNGLVTLVVVMILKDTTTFQVL